MKSQTFDASIKLSEYGCQIIGQNFQRFVEQEEAVLKDNDSEPLHQMRVGMRRLRTAVQVFKTAIVLPKTISDSSIGKIAKGLGETRDLDVLNQELKTHYQPLLQKSEQPTFDEVLKQLHQTRSESFSHLKKTLTGDRYQELKQSIQAWIDHPAYTPMGALPVLHILPDLLLPLICQIFLHPGWLVGTTVQAETVTLIPIGKTEALNQQLQMFGNVLHDLRKQMKGVRYQAEFFSAFYDESYLQRIEEFKAIQDILGQLQDQVVLRHFLESALKADLAKVLPTIDREMQQDEVMFWQHWQPLQQQYLDSQFRESLRSLLTTPIVLTPTSKKRKEHSDQKPQKRNLRPETKNH